MDEDECLSIILSMGFPNIEEIKKALRFAKNDVNEAVAILTNEQPLNVDDLSVDIDMKDVSRRGGNASSSHCDAKMGPDDLDDLGDEDGKGMEFPTHNLYELEQRVFQDNWSIPYKREESLGRCLVAATNLARENLMEADDNCKKFIDRVMPEAFRKLLTSSATHRWQAEIQEGIYTMLELYIDLVLTRLHHDPVPVSLLNILATAFDLKNGWNSKNKEQSPKGRWSEGGNRSILKDYAKSSSNSDSFSRDQYGWLCDLINQFGDQNGFELISSCVAKPEVSARSMAALLHPLANCAELLVKETVAPFLQPCMEKAFRYVDKIDEAELKSKEVNAVSDLLSALKLLCNQFCPEDVKNCDRLRLSTICRMLQTPLFSSKMNALKEVSRLIEESEQNSNTSYSSTVSGKKTNTLQHIGVDEVVEWMAENKVLTIALEGNIDQVQYTDRIKSIVEFLGPRLSLEELTKMWNLQDSPNPHVMDNVHAIMSSAASKFSLAQFEHLTGLIKDKWGKSNDRLREKLLVFIGQIGRDAKQIKSTQAILQLLWDVSHLDSLPKHLVERALSEQLNILTEMTLNKDANRKTYINRCVEDIKADGICVLPAVNHLHMICKSYTKGTTIYSKADKATLGNLNEQHGIVKLLCNSLKQAHKLAERCNDSHPLKPENIIDGRYTHEEYVRGHLDLMKFFLKEGDLYLSWGRCQEIWDTLVANPSAITFDRDLCFEWFENCLTDLENETQKEFFQKMLLQVAPTDLTCKGFDCYKAYFESVNHTEGKLRKGSSPLYTVECMDLNGLDFLWNLITDCKREDIADLAIDYFLQKTYLSVNAKLKKESVKLHQKFIESCYSRLEHVFSPDDQKRDDAQEGCEIEMTVAGAVESSENQPDLSSRKAKTEVSSVFKVANFSDEFIRCQKMQRIRRLLLLAERYVSTIEATHPSNRSILPHAAMFRGRPLRIKIFYDTKKEEFTLESHTNEMVCDVKHRLSEMLKQPIDQLNIQCDDVTLGNNKDRCLVGFIGSHEGQTWVVKSQGMATTASSSSTALVVYDETATDCAVAEGSSATTSRFAVMNEQEKALPGVVMASGGRYFTMLYQLASLNDSRTLQGIRRLIHLIPTDPTVSDALDAISYHSTKQPLASADASPKLSPRSKKGIPDNLEEAKKQLAELFDASAEGMSAFRVLYNLEVLSGKLLPTKSEATPKFSNDFLEAGGLRVILDVFQHDALPVDVNCDVRQSIYLVALQLSCYLLCGEGVGLHRPQMLPAPPASPVPKPNPLTSPVMKPTPPKKSALDATASLSSTIGKSPVVVSSSRVVQTMLEKEFSDVVSCLMRIVWAAAAGNLQLASSCLPNPVANEHQTSSARFYVCRRSSHSSTGSSGSTGSDGASGANSNHTAESLHPGVCVQQSFVHPGDSQIAGEALQLLVTCLQMRSNNISLFYNLPMVNDFVIDTVLGSPSESVRRRACSEFQRLSSIRLTARSLNLDGDSGDAKSASHRLLTPKQFLTKTILKAPVPLWMPSCKARGISHAILAQCTEYFDLRSYLLSEMSFREQECQGVSSKQMIEDELNFLHNYTPCHRPVDCTLLAGHLRLVEALLLCEGVDKVAVGANLIKELLNVYLFPSSRLIADGALSNGGLVSIDITEARNINPKCDTSDSRVAAYSLLVELARNCPENTSLIVEELIRMHHTYNETLSKEFEYEPPIERRAACNFVGLKNAGATCYMNSVIQQLYNVPNISDQILNVEMDAVDEETIFYQLQNVFGHLLESKLQHYIPEKFWRCFRLFGQPVNVREQQDAFEFFTQIVDQVDEYLHSQGKPKVFSRHFEGVFSDQKICQGCPHRYEREQTFMALNLTVKSNNLQESLDQFVKGELLEGDNAYFCEKCQEKRNAIKRMCIRTLPQTLVIQLKRFHYDWETNRALKFDDFFQFPWTIDMGPYTTEGIQRAESDPISVAAAVSENARSASGHDTPLAYRKVSFSSSFSRNNPDLHYPYELVGIVVHSGQANAGHYYSYIKERRGHSLTNRNKNRWFKFNDTTVEEFEMTDEKMMNECFGGSYKVKKTGAAPNLPEDRQRYWNAYMLFYESRVEKKSARTPRRSASHSQHLQRGAMSQRKISMPVGPMSAAESPAPKESLSQLSDLLEKSEKKSLFASRMPSAIERGIQEENLRFLQNRDVFCEDYYQFICQLISANRGFAPPPPPRLFEVRGSNPIPELKSTSTLAVESVRLAVHFLLNSYYHVKKRDRQIQNEILGHVEAIIEKNVSACEWLLHYLAQEGLQYMRTLLLECDAREVRINFSSMIERTFHFYKKFNGETESDDVNLILATLVGLIDKDVANNCKSSGQFFWILSKFAKMGVRQSQQLFQLNAFRNTIKFLLNVEPEPEEDEPALLARQRRWTVSQSREFGELHAALAHLILACDTRPHRTESPEDVEEMESKLPAARVFPSSENQLLKMPDNVASVLYGKLSALYIREAVCACREVTVSIAPIVEVLVQVSYSCQKFSKILVEEMMRQYNNVSSGELKNLSTLLVEILALSDSLQQERLKFVIDGDQSLKIDGLLTLVKNNQASDSCRSYQCIKILVNAANKSPAVKDQLLLDSDRWQWAVNWLKNKMSSGSIGDANGSQSTYWSSSSLSPTSTSDVVSNEDPSTRTFHRTTSALMTLEDANAILAEFDRASPTCEERVSPTCDDNMDTGNGSLPLVNNDDDDMPDLHQMVTSTDLSNDSKDN